MHNTYLRLNLHVGASGISVIRAARTKIAEHHRRDQAKRQARKDFYRAMLHEHKKARDLYNAVMWGTL